MKNERMFLRCNICGNIVGVINDSGVTPVCCGEDMEHLLPNTTDAAQEKHVPAARREGGRIYVDVGSAPHPMTPEHHIAWVAVACGGRTQRVALDHTGKPAADFCDEGGPCTVYAYCNLHGLWAAELK